MTKSGHAKFTSFRQEAEQTAKDERAIQSKVDRSDKAAGKQEKKGGAMQAGARVYPEPPLPKQHLKKPGHEADLELAPMSPWPISMSTGTPRKRSELSRPKAAAASCCQAMWRTPNSARMPSGGRSTSSGDSIFSSTTRRSRSTSTASRS